MNPDRRLRRDARLLAGDPEAAALLECLGQHLFDPNLDASFMAKVCGAPRSVRDRLAAKIGPLKEYTTELRMAEAARLVRDTKVPITEIGKRVGYLVPRTFRRAFVNAHGVKPNDMRQQAQAGDAEGATTADQAADPSAPDDRHETPKVEADEDLPRRALARRLRRWRALGMLDPSRAAELRFKLRRLHPELDQVEAKPPRAPSPQVDSNAAQHPVYLTPTGDWLEEIAAGHAYGQIIDLPTDDQRFGLLHGLRLGNITAFHQLFRVCNLLIPYDADKAVRIARLGVELVEPHRDLMGNEGDHWKAMAWVGLARVQALAGDYGGADQSLGFAGAEVGGEEALTPWVEIELRRVEGMIMKRQRRPLEAERAMDRAVELGRDLDRSHVDRRETVLERLELASAQHDVDAGFALITELEELIKAFPDGDKRITLWRGQVFFHGARAHAARGKDCCAIRCLRQAMDDISADPRCDTDTSLGILFTFIIHEMARLCCGDQPDYSETLLRHAVDRYRRFEIPILEAAAEAELAVVCALRGHRAEARQLAASAADFLSDLPALHREAWSATRKLRALANGGAEAPEGELMELMAELRQDLDRVAWEITGSQAMAAADARQAKGDEAAPPAQSTPEAPRQQRAEEA